jgi:hypothetical protein
MFEIGPTVPEVQRSASTMVSFVVMLSVLTILCAIAAAVWIYRDAEARGKNGIAAALIALLSVFYGLPATVIVLCAWVLFRPDRNPKGAFGSQDPLPDKLPSDISAVPDSAEFLGELEQDS